MRTIKTFSVSTAVQSLKQQLLNWSESFEEAIFLDSNQTEHLYPGYDAILAVEAFTAIKSDEVDAFNKLDDYQTTTKDWLFGYLSYDLKNDTEFLTSKNEDQLKFPELYFIQPKKIWLLKSDYIEAHYLRMVDDEIDSDFESILKTKITETPSQALKFSPR